MSPLLICVDIIWSHLAPYYSSVHIIMLLFLTIFVGITSFFLYQPFQLLLDFPVCWTVSFFLNIFLFFPFFGKEVTFCYILHSEVIVGLHNAFGYSCEMELVKKRKKTNKTVICNLLLKSLLFIIQKIVYEIPRLLKIYLLKYCFVQRYSLSKAWNEITLFIRRIFPFLRWKLFLP